MSPRPVLVLGAAIVAFLLAVVDAIDTSVLAMRPEGTGAILGTILRDTLLVVAGVMLLRRVTWAGWMLVVLFALGLLRLLAADRPVEYASALGIVGMVLLMLPEPRAWWTRAPAAPAPSAG